MTDPLDVDGLVKALKERVATAYANGFRDGNQAALARFMAVAQNLSASPGEPGATFLTAAPHEVGTHTITDVIGSVAQGARQHYSKAEARAPRGLVAKAIREVLQTAPGLSVTEIGNQVVAKYPQVSLKSVGNQLRRGEGSDYVRSDKYSWFLKGQSLTETAPASGEAGAVDLYR